MERAASHCVFYATLLTARELEIVRLVAKGWKNREIAKRIGQTEHVTKNYMRPIYDKLGMHNRVELALWYVRHIETQTD